jgi:hypothetical protein
MEFFAENATINPLINSLTKRNITGAVFLKNNKQFYRHLERYLKTRTKLISTLRADRFVDPETNWLKNY